MRRKPPVVAIARSEPVEQLEQHAFLPGAAGAADQAVGEGGGRQHRNIAWPSVEMRVHCRQCRFGVTRRQQAEKRDVALFPRGQTGSEGIGGSYRRAGRRGVAALEQRVRPCGMGKGKAAICGDGAIERLDRAGVHRQLRLAAL